MERKSKIGPIIQWKGRAQVIRQTDAVFHRLESLDGRYVLVKTESLLGGQHRYPDRWTPYYWDQPTGCNAPRILTDTAGHMVQYEVSRRMKSRRAADRRARELAIRACELHATGQPIPPARTPINRRQVLRRTVRRIEADI